VPSDIELDKLHAAIADNGEELQKIKANRLLSAGQKLLRERACKRERRKLDLRVKLFQEGIQIKRLEGTCEFYQTPLGKAQIEGRRHTAEKHHQLRRAGLALRGGSSTPYQLSQKDVYTPPPDPAAAASIALTRAREKHAETLRELEQLSKDADEANEALVEHSLPRIRGVDENSQPSSPSSPNQPNKPKSSAAAELETAALTVERISFKRFGDKVSVIPPFSDTALLNTCNLLSTALSHVRTVALDNNGKVTPAQRKRILGTELVRIVTDEQWEEWIDVFAKENATAINIALVFLKKTTGLTIGRLKNRCTNARKRSNNGKGDAA
jgi:hypothetical protein